MSSGSRVSELRWGGGGGGVINTTLTQTEILCAFKALSGDSLSVLKVRWANSVQVWSFLGDRERDKEANKEIDRKREKQRERKLESQEKKEGTGFCRSLRFVADPLTSHQSLSA